jgi:MoxR-like ATPase
MCIRDRDTCLSIKENINKIIIGKSEIIDLILTSTIAGGHILLEDTPGTGKTVLAKSLAKSIDGTFNRIQFTPDLLPSDITGLKIFNQKISEFKFIPGPVFSNILLADEINRATPRTQSSLLEVMEEKQVTTDGETRILDKPFLVIATENPIENSGTFPLPEAQLDRFMMKLSMGYTTLEEEISIIDRFISNDPLSEILPICSKDDIVKMQQAIKEVFVHKDLREYIAKIIHSTRKNPTLSLGVSPRGTLALLKASQSYAAIKGRSYVIPDDIKILAPYVLAHRIIPSNALNTLEGNTIIIKNLLNNIPIPTEEWDK